VAVGPGGHVAVPNRSDLASPKKQHHDHRSKILGIGGRRNEFALAIAVGLHDQYPEVTPIYDEVGNLTGWRGIELRGF
jgi:hypothetical protein